MAHFLHSQNVIYIYVDTHIEICACIFMYADIVVKDFDQ